MKKVKGALAIEATISFTVFIVFLFMLMAVVKMSLVYITINDVTAETVKKIAGMAYPITFINDAIDDGFESNQFLKNAAEADNSDSKKVNMIELAGNGEWTSIGEYIYEDYIGEALSGDSTTSITNLVEKFKDNLAADIINCLFDLKQNILTKIMAKSYLDMVDDTNALIDTDNIRVVYFTPPLSETEFNSTKKDISKATGIAEEKLSADDVILMVEYDYSIIVPFFPKYDVTLTSIAVEKAWLNGYSHIPNSDKEGLETDLSVTSGKTVEWTVKYGKRYHKLDCSMVNRETTGETETGSISKAEGKGLTPCLICKPGSDD